MADDKTELEELEELEAEKPAELEAAPAAKTEPAEAPKPTEPEPKGALALTVDQFIRARGHRPERSAGFAYYVTAKYGARHRLTVAEWNQIWDAWWNQPAGLPVERKEG